MKKIAVLVHALAVEYTSIVIQGIYDYFKDKKDVALFIAQTRQPHYKSGISEYQYWRSAEYLKADSIDALIVLSNSYVYSIEKDKLKETFDMYGNKPIVSLGLDIGIENSYYTVSKPYTVYDEIIDYLKNQQGCKKIGFFSANSTGSPEAIDRFEAYKQALAKHNLEFNEKWILEGRFTGSSAREYLEKHYTDKSQLDFDAILCANDLMAVATLEYFTSLGVRVPEELKVVGFDNTSHATLCNPPLATVDQQIYEQGKITANLVERILNGEKVDKVTETPLKAVYRQSCGCSEDYSSERLRTIFNQFNYFSDLTRIDVLIDMLRSSVTMTEFTNKYRAIIDVTGFDTLYCCIFDEPKLVNREDSFTVPETARLLLKIDEENNCFEYYEEGQILYPKKQMFPDGIKPGCYMFQPLYIGNLVYGYYLCHSKLRNFAANSVNLKMLASAIVQNYEYTLEMKNKRYLQEQNEELLHNNSDLSKEAKTDELTKVLNRRGFMEYAQKLIDFSAEMGNSGLVFFADLDGLKTINDTYGHEFGDKAIQTQAQVLQKVFRQSDIIGRLSGDEFAVVAAGMPESTIEKHKQFIDSFNYELSKLNELPFTISLSFGAVPFNAENHNLVELLKQADSKLYEEKRIKHAGR